MRRMNISVTEAARNFAGCVNRARRQNVTFVLIENGAPVARLVPENKKVCTGRMLSKMLSKTNLPETEAAAWFHDLQMAHKTLSRPTGRWQ